MGFVVYEDLVHDIVVDEGCMNLAVLCRRYSCKILGVKLVRVVGRGVVVVLVVSVAPLCVVPDDQDVG